MIIEIPMNLKNKNKEELILLLNESLGVIKKLQKENEELKNDYENLSNSVVVKNHCIKNSIPVSLVEEKLEELIKEGRHYNANKIEVLQELLEGRK